MQAKRTGIVFLVRERDQEVMFLCLIKIKYFFLMIELFCKGWVLILTYTYPVY